jgi:hypothetical protein
MKKMFLYFYLTVVPDALSRAGRDAASDVVGRPVLAEWLEAAVTGREAKCQQKLFFDVC